MKEPKLYNAQTLMIWLLGILSAISILGLLTKF